MTADAQPLVDACAAHAMDDASTSSSESDSDDPPTVDAVDATDAADVAEGVGGVDAAEVVVQPSGVADVPAAPEMADAPPTAATPTALAKEDAGATPVAEPPPGDAAPTKRLFLEFTATQSEPAFESVFLQSGGALAAAAARGTTDFAVSGSTTSVVSELDGGFGQVVRIELPPETYSLSNTEECTIVASNHTKLLVTNIRSGAAINGSVVSGVAGLGAPFLSRLLRQPTAVVPLKYSNSHAHSSVLAISEIKILDDSGRRHAIHFESDDKADAVQEAAENLMAGWSEAAWKLRRETLVFEESPSLTKTLVACPSGINNSGYDLMHNVLESPHPIVSLATLESLMKHVIGINLDFDDERIAGFLDATKTRGLVAAQQASVVASSLSMVVAHLMNYKSDGVVIMSPSAGTNVASESWLREAARSAECADDCDKGAMTAMALVDQCINASEDALEALPYVRAVHNSVVPYYTPMLCVVAASSGEASGGGGEGGGVAGHALTVWMPSLDVLSGLETGSKRTINGVAVISSEQSSKVAEARLKALFDPEVVSTLPTAERDVLLNGKTAAGVLQAFKTSETPHVLKTLMVEGTTPALSTMHSEGEQAVADAEHARRDEIALKKVGPTIGRAVRQLHTSGFVLDLVEANLPPSSPLWSAPGPRELDAAVSQLVFAKTSNITSELSKAGASPKQAVQGNYNLVPLVTVDKQSAEVLDFASFKADADVMPPRVLSENKLSKFKSKNLQASLASLEALHKHLQSLPETAVETHGVSFVLAYATLTGNVAAVDHFCDRIKAVAADGVVDALSVSGLMVDHDGKEAGKVVVVTVGVPV